MSSLSQRASWLSCTPQSLQSRGYFQRNWSRRNIGGCWLRRLSFILDNTTIVPVVPHEPRKYWKIPAQWWMPDIWIERRTSFLSSISARYNMPNTSGLAGTYPPYYLRQRRTFTCCTMVILYTCFDSSVTELTGIVASERDHYIWMPIQTESNNSRNKKLLY